MEQLHEAECEVTSLKTMFQRMILTQEEMVFHIYIFKLTVILLKLLHYANDTLYYVFRKS